MQNRNITISDPTLRDGNHAVHHSLSLEVIAKYCTLADAAGIPIVEVGHGNGLGASSMQVGIMPFEDNELLSVARKNLKRSKLGIHAIPGFATVKRDFQQAIELGVDVIRVAAHVTEADTTERHIKYVRENNRTAYGVLMMSHMAEETELIAECLKMESYGANAVIIMDSAGAYLPRDVTHRIGLMTEALRIPVGFHGHNNLAMAVANSVAAIEAGATIIDGTARGFGAGAGNTQLEVLVSVLHKMNFETGIDLFKLLDAADFIEQELADKLPAIKSTSIVSGLAGVFSGFAKPVERIAKRYGVDPREIFIELGKRKAVAGQEDLIIEVAQFLSTK